MTQKKYTEGDIIKMPVSLIDIIFVVCGHTIFQEIVGILMGTNCALSYFLPTNFKTKTSHRSSLSPYK